MSDPQAQSAPEESFMSHLVELRDRLLRSLIAVAVILGVLCLYPGPGAIYDILAAPLTAALPEGTKMVAIGVITPFMVPLKVTAMVAFLLALPYILYQAWAFIAPGLYAHEKRLGIPLIVSSSFLFMLGMAFCYFFVFGQVFSFINGFAPKSITPAPDIEAYLSFVMTMFLAFGIAFQVQDDYLDAFGDPEKFGKEVGGDIRQNKKTFLAIHTRDVASDAQRQQLQTLMQENPADKVQQVLSIMKACGVDEWALQLKQQYFNKAMQHLEAVAVLSSRKQQLYDLANFLIARDH